MVYDGRCAVPDNHSMLEPKAAMVLISDYRAPLHCLYSGCCTCLGVKLPQWRLRHVTWSKGVVQEVIMVCAPCDAT